MGAAAGALCLLCLRLCLSPHPAAAFQPHLQRTTPRGRALLKVAVGEADGGGAGQASHSRVCVIGGGAAGFMAAIEAGRGLRGVAGAEVVLLEGTKKVRGMVQDV